jgi:hypothetical protein
MLRDGAAWYLIPESSSQNQLEREDYKKNEAAAKEEKRGVWSSGTVKPSWEIAAEKEQQKLVAERIAENLRIEKAREQERALAEKIAENLRVEKLQAEKIAENQRIEKLQAERIAENKKVEKLQAEKIAENLKVEKLIEERLREKEKTIANLQNLKDVQQAKLESSSQASKNVSSILQVSSNPKNFLDVPLKLAARLEISSLYYAGYKNAQNTHYAFRISDETDSVTVYMPRNDSSEGLRRQLLDAGPTASIKVSVNIMIKKERFDARDLSSGFNAELLSVAAPEK